MKDEEVVSLFKEVSISMRSSDLVTKLATEAWRSRLYAPFQEDVSILINTYKDLDKIKALPDTMLRNNTIAKIEFYLRTGMYIESYLQSLEEQLDALETAATEYQETIEKSVQDNDVLLVQIKRQTEELKTLRSWISTQDSEIELLKEEIAVLEDKVPKFWTLFRRNK